MAEQRPSTEVSVAAEDLEAALARICADWGVERDAIEVETVPDEAEPGRVRLRVTLAALAADEDDDERQATAVDEDAQPDEELERARTVLADLLERMDVEATVEGLRGEPDGDIVPIVLDVQGPDLGLLIGRKGETLAALQYITRLIVSKQVGHSIDLIVDVQGHKKRREEQLRRLARRLAEQAVERQRVMTLEPMPANERRIIHLELRDYPGVLTESVGEGTHRKVTIIPRPT
jgi:spoIIIJ-associated protein